MGKWTYRIAIIVMIAVIAGAAIYWIWFRTVEDFVGPWIDPDYPTGTGWLLYPNGGEAVSGIVTIRWDTSKTPGLDSDDEIEIGVSHDVRGGASVFNLGEWPYPQWVFQHENWEGCYCSMYSVITKNAPNTGSYEWNATQTLEEYNGEWYPYYIKLMGGKYMDASNTYFNITG